MTALRSSRPRPFAPARSGFTLTELLVVIALIAVLVSVLLAALGKVREKGEETETLATMQAFSNACDAFQQEHGIFPGVVPEEVLINDADDGVPKISGTENAILHLIGGYMREVDVTAEEYMNNADAEELSFDTSGLVGYPNPYKIKIDVKKLGEGPIINGKPYAPYFTASKTNLAVANGQMVDDTTMEDPSSSQLRLPEVIDAWGQPVLYLRRLRSVGELTVGNPRNVQFHMTALLPYTKSTGLGKLEGRQDVESLFNTSDEVESLLEIIIEHPSLPDKARGAYMIMSAGPDGVFLSTQDGPGAPGELVTDLDSHFSDDTPPAIIKEYDDVILFGGS